ncbi:MAG: hypothetical protein UT08_C0018G0037 [Candidatus Woesebacteria bacterium GW2011_GWB1_38_8]|uniref:Uncharacterized protein n=1 Tax=Candidatus Woesebacteria bacterium GW2011_GWB1_38_8 TaxID=1618570 RepID=A0A0G0P534_9BACT|nr:MAG: hypothetical protein UT08_C0018G0037 [Candidatus Woesebacteria bacterium GW2011_GWB1_38_8]
MEENQNRVGLDQNPQIPGSVQPVTEVPVQQPVTDTSQSPVEPQPLSEPEVPRTGVPTSPSSKGSNKILLIGLLFVITAAIVGGGYLYLQNQKLKGASSQLTPTPIIELPTPSPTTGWMMYADDSEKYSFSYPEAWRLHQGNPNQLYSYRAEESSNGHFDPERDKDKIKIEIYTSTNPPSSLEEYVKEEDEEASELRGVEVKREYKEVLIDNQRALKTQTDSSFSVGFNTILLVYVQNPLTKRVHTFAAAPRYDINKEIIDQILSTFQFTK